MIRCIYNVHYDQVWTLKIAVYVDHLKTKRDSYERLTVNNFSWQNFIPTVSIFDNSSFTKLWEKFEQIVIFFMMHFTNSEEQIFKNISKWRIWVTYLWGLRINEIRNYVFSYKKYVIIFIFRTKINVDKIDKIDFRNNSVGCCRCILVYYYRVSHRKDGASCTLTWIKHWWFFRINVLKYWEKLLLEKRKNENCKDVSELR